MPQTRAELRAERLLEELQIEDVPVPVDDVAKRCGVRVALASLENDVSAMLYRRGSQALILVNRRHQENRRRFSIAHELGHFLLHQGDVFIDTRVRVNFRDSQSSLGIDEEEIQANRFAAELLMPARQVLRAVSEVRKQTNQPKDEALLSELARVFKVSAQAIQFRLANLGLLGTV